MCSIMSCVCCFWFTSQVKVRKAYFVPFLSVKGIWSDSHDDVISDGLFSASVGFLFSLWTGISISHVLQCMYYRKRSDLCSVAPHKRSVYRTVWELRSWSASDRDTEDTISVQILSFNVFLGRHFWQILTLHNQFTSDLLLSVLTIPQEGMYCKH